MKTLSEQLNTIQAAIDSVLITGQSYSFEGRVVTKANLAELIAIKDAILANLAAHGPNYVEGVAQSSSTYKIGWGSE